MVRFLNLSRPANERITVWCEPQDAGFRLLRRDPDGTLRTERHTDPTAVYAATVRWQAALTRTGWQPVETIRTPLARRRATRAGQFHR
ncbi:MAG: hypothetical protein QGI10_08015 [Vicinamibacterales bacterium]|jgi:hypothetical protein|nr:hypothetical protein [Vicinamibacterales bacterium]MDP7479199.1 hypothetical protein [Vicinamibacterales bacterium]MDP7691050.1 hypothetical protein [Vicinamibacterales bacterium]HJN46958.1 hypothetical protein [Vicinamibacterales bacterium]|tara:strand:+ start:5028 stop:5291 length:264 start_codon:yes stop_codon:yes gene_type:complete